MKKILAILLIVVTTLSLFACGNSDSESSQTEERNPFNSTEQSSTADETENNSLVTDETDEPEETEETEETNPPSVSESKLPEFKKDATIEETIVYNENDVVITVNELTYTNSAAEVKVSIENNSSENLSFSCGSIGYGCNAINGFIMYGGFLNCDIAPGKKSKETIKFTFDEMIFNGIFEIADIEIGFRISNDDYDTVDSFQAHIYTSIYDNFDYDPMSYQNIIQSNEVQKKFKYSLEYFSDSIIFDDADVTVESIALLKNKNDELSLAVEVLNSSDSMISFNASDIYINNILLSSGTFDSALISNGNRCVISLDFASLLSDTNSELLGIDTVNSVNFTIGINDFEYNELTEDSAVEIEISSNNYLPDMTGEEIYNNNNIRIIFKGLAESEYSYVDDLYAYFLVENNCGESVSISDKYDSLSINGYMADYYYMSSIDIFDGKYGLMKLTLPDSTLEELDITSIDEITQIEFEVEIKDMEYNEIDDFTVSIDKISK